MSRTGYFIHPFSLGGLLLVIIGIRGVVLSPIASPLLGGPGSIVNVMLVDSAHGRVFALGACIVAFAGAILILNHAHVLYRLMGRVGSLAVGRMMQIFIIAIGIKFCFTALATVFPSLAK